METGGKQLSGTRVGIIEMGLDLIDRVPDELWTEVHDIVQETGIKTILKKKSAKKTGVKTIGKKKKIQKFLRRPYK